MLARALLTFALLAAPAAPTAADDLTVFAAASTATALDRAAAAFEGESGVRARVAYAGSSALARQIEAGAPADVFLSASPDWMDHLEGQGLVEPGTRVDLLGNALVLIAPAADARAPVALAPGLDLAGMLGDGRLAVALIDAVPAGVYAHAALEWLGAWDAVEARTAQADNARAALALVGTGAAPLGIVYATDAAAEPRVAVLGAFPPGAHPPIVYPVAALRGGDAAGARAFIDHLRGPGRAAFEAEGFVVLAGPVGPSPAPTATPAR